jgi:hypothetical protein
MERIEDTIITAPVVVNEDAASLLIAYYKEAKLTEQPLKYFKEKIGNREFPYIMVWSRLTVLDNLGMLELSAVQSYLATNNIQLKENFATRIGDFELSPNTLIGIQLEQAASGFVSKIKTFKLREGYALKPMWQFRYINYDTLHNASDPRGIVHGTNGINGTNGTNGVEGYRNATDGSCRSCRDGYTASDLTAQERADLVRKEISECQKAIDNVDTIVRRIEERNIAAQEQYKIDYAAYNARVDAVRAQVGRLGQETTYTEPTHWTQDCVPRCSGIWRYDDYWDWNTGKDGHKRCRCRLTDAYVQQKQNIYDSQLNAALQSKPPPAVLEAINVDLTCQYCQQNLNITGDNNILENVNMVSQCIATAKSDLASLEAAAAEESAAKAAAEAAKIAGPGSLDGTIKFDKDGKFTSTTGDGTSAGTSDGTSTGTQDTFKIGDFVVNIKVFYFILFLLFIFIVYAIKGIMVKPSEQVKQSTT